MQTHLIHCFKFQKAYRGRTASLRDTFVIEGNRAGLTGRAVFAVYTLFVCIVIEVADDVCVVFSRLLPRRFSLLISVFNAFLFKQKEVAAIHNKPYVFSQQYPLICTLCEVLNDALIFYAVSQLLRE